MRTSGISLCFLNAPALCLFWLMKHAVDSFQLSATDMVEGAYGGSVMVQCQYNRQFREYTKYWCKGSIYELCEIVVKTPRRRHSDRSSIVDNKEEGVFTITMTSLQESDSDMYWCVIARHGRNVYASVRLSVSQAVITTAALTTANPSQQDQISWWVTLRWIIFISMLFCLVSTHVAVWRIKAVRETQLRQLQYQNSNIYE